MKDDKYLELIIECIFDCPKDLAEEIQAKVAKIIADLSQEEKLIKIGVNMTKFSDLDLKMHISQNIDPEDLN